MLDAPGRRVGGQARRLLLLVEALSTHAVRAALERQQAVRQTTASLAPKAAAGSRQALNSVIAREDDTPAAVSAELGEAFKVTLRDDPNGDLYHYRLQKSVLIAKFIYYNPSLNWGPKKLTSIRFYFEHSGFDSAGMQF